MFDKDLEEIRHKQSWKHNTWNEKYTRRNQYETHWAGEQISELEDRMVEITAEEQNKEKRMKNHNIYFCHDCLSETHSPLRVTWDYLSPQFVDA